METYLFISIGANVAIGLGFVWFVFSQKPKRETKPYQVKETVTVLPKKDSSIIGTFESKKGEVLTVKMFKNQFDNDVIGLFGADGFIYSSESYGKYTPEIKQNMFAKWKRLEGKPDEQIIEDANTIGHFNRNGKILSVKIHKSPLTGSKRIGLFAQDGVIEEWHIFYGIDSDETKSIIAGWERNYGKLIKS